MDMMVNSENMSQNIVFPVFPAHFSFCGVQDKKRLEVGCMVNAFS
jgi:hypothetical protein